jgi:hypothetical protein
LINASPLPCPELLPFIAGFDSIAVWLYNYVKGKNVTQETTVEEDPPRGKFRLTLVFNFTSHHFKQRHFTENGKRRHFNEFNPGIGFEYGLGKPGGAVEPYISAGIYKNSIYRLSTYVSIGAETDRSKFLGIGIGGGLLTGYPDMKVPFAALPYARIGDADHVNLKINVIPHIKNLTPTVVGPQIRVPVGKK